MDLLMNGEELSFRADVRAFVAAELTDEMRDAQSRCVGPYPEKDASTAWQQALATAGWAAPAWPREHGGPGWSAIQRFIFESECALAGAPVVYPIGIRLVGPVLMRFGTPEQCARWLPRILAAQDYWCQGFSEPGAGSDLASLSTRAVRDGDDFIVNGAKIWTTHAHYANWMFALVRTSDGARRQEGISVLAIDMALPGVEVHPIISIGGDHDVNQVFLADVRVPASCLIGAEGEGWTCAKYLLEFERGTGLFSSRLRWALGRVEQVIGSDRLDHEGRVRLGKLSFEIDAFEMLELMTLGTLGPGEAPGPASSMLKLRASRLKQAVARLAMDLMGPAALQRSGEGLGPILVTDYLNSRAATVFGGTSEVQLGIIARTLAGL